MTSRVYSHDSDNWVAPRATAGLDAVVPIPGSKSLTNRELVLAALSDRPSAIHRPLRSRDSSLMVDAIAQLGVGCLDSVTRGSDTLLVSPAPLHGNTTIDCGLAGTVMRFVPPLAALADGPVTFDGDAGARARPMGTTIDSLRKLGVLVDDEGRGTLPFTVHGTGAVAGGDVSIDATESSQFVSGLLLSAPRFDNGITLRHTGARLPSTPHIDMTIACLRARGVTVSEPAAGVWRVEPGPISGIDIDMEPDLSNAAPFLVAALVAGGRVTIPHWPKQTTQVGDQLGRYVEMLGGSVWRDERGLTVDGGDGLIGGTPMNGVTLDLREGGELAPALIAVAALAAHPSTFIGIAHLRGHETNRLAALVAEINRLGGNASELPDGIHLEPAPLHGGIWRTYHDHRMATAGAIIGLAVDDVLVENIGTTAKTMPEFPNLWTAMLAS